MKFWNSIAMDSKWKKKWQFLCIFSSCCCLRNKRKEKGKKGKSRRRKYERFMEYWSLKKKMENDFEKGDWDKYWFSIICPTSKTKISKTCFFSNSKPTTNDTIVEEINFDTFGVEKEEVRLSNYEHTSRWAKFFLSLKFKISKC